MVMKAGIVQDLQGELASWRLKKSWGFNSSPKARKMGSVLLKHSSDRTNDLFLGGRSVFRFFPGFQLIGWDPPTLGRLTCFTQPPDWNVCLMRYPLTEVPRVRFDQIAGYRVVQSIWHIKLTIILSESTFAEGVKLRLSFIFLSMDVQFSQHYFLKRLPFLHQTAFATLSKACGMCSCGFWVLLGSALCGYCSLCYCSHITSLEIR